MKTYLLIFSFLVLTGSCSQESDPNIAKEEDTEVSFRPEKVLFIGNSHTNYNGGMDTALKGFLDAIELSYSPQVERMALDGYSMEDHASDPNSLAKLQEQDWDVVILQENSSRAANEILEAKLGIESVSRKIKNDKAKLYLFMTWAYRHQPGMLNGIRTTHEEIAPLINAKIVPVGLAFKEVQNDTNTTIDLYNQDGVHASAAGTFLAAAMFYEAIYSMDPTLNSNTAGLDKADADYLKGIAHKVLSEYKK
ncbi:MAG: DUF4886 domain-containing protein [Flavobacteriaceae bacterium]